MPREWRIVVGILSLALALAGMNVPAAVRLLLRRPGVTNSAWLIAARAANLAGVLLLARTVGLSIYFLGRPEPS
jgi:hypothetical protein